MLGPTFSDYYRNALEEIKTKILNESDAQILGSETNDLAKFYYQTYAFSPIEFENADIACEIKKEVRRVPAHQRERGYYSGGDIDWEYESVIISLPFKDNPKIHLIKKLGTGSYTLDGVERNLKYDNNVLRYAFDIKGYGFQTPEDHIVHEINTKSGRLIQILSEKNDAIDTENTIFLRSLENLITLRKNKLNIDKERLNSLIQKINIPLKQKPEATITNIRIDTKKFVQVVKPTPKLPEEYTLAEDKLLDVLSFVDNQCKNFERTPSSYKQLGEEQLRDIILSALNGIFEGDATGETFVKKGKTDIHLKIAKGEILIFECKIWGGEKLFLETIDQLIGYVTWRHNYGVIIMFCKNKDFSKILAQIPGIIKKHLQYVLAFNNISKSHFISQNSFPEDNDKSIKLHYLIYNLYSD